MHLPFDTGVTVPDSHVRTRQVAHASHIPTAASLVRQAAACSTIKPASVGNSTRITLKEPAQSLGKAFLASDWLTKCKTLPRAKKPSPPLKALHSVAAFQQA